MTKEVSEYLEYPINKIVWNVGFDGSDWIKFNFSHDICNVIYTFIWF